MAVWELSVKCEVVRRAGEYRSVSTWELVDLEVERCGFLDSVTTYLRAGIDSSFVVKISHRTAEGNFNMSMVKLY